MASPQFEPAADSCCSADSWAGEVYYGDACSMDSLAKVVQHIAESDDCSWSTVETHNECCYLMEALLKCHDHC